jgi:hypothetical protein
MSEEFTPEFMAQQRELAERATERPWIYGISQAGKVVWTDENGKFSMPEFYKNMGTNAEYCAAACNHYPAALDEIDALRAQVAELIADRDSESRWAKEYLARAEAAEKDAERLAGASKAAFDMLSGNNWDKMIWDELVNIISAALAAHDAAKGGPP